MGETRFRILIVTAIILLGATAYLNTIDADWVWDDVSSVLLNKHIQDTQFLPLLFQEDQHPFGRGQGNFYRPLVAVSFMIDFALSYDPQQDAATDAGYPNVKTFLFHLTNILWHIAATIMLFALLTLLKAPQFVRATTSLLFIVHPFHTEAVAYISGRADMMAATLMFAALCATRWRRTPKHRIIGTTLSLLLFTAALLCKESAMIFPALLTLCTFVRITPKNDAPTPKNQKLLNAIPLALSLIVLSIYITLRKTTLNFAPTTEAQITPLLQRATETAQAFALYCQQLFLPTGLHMERTLDNATTLNTLTGILLILLCLTAIAAALKAKQPRIVLALTWFIAAWLPISGLYPLNAPMAEHWMYVPMAGFWWALAEAALLLANTPARKKALPIPAYALCILFLFLTTQRNQDWSNNENIFTATLAQNAQTLRAHYILAVANESLLENNPGAKRHFNAALKLHEKNKRTASESDPSQYIIEDEIDIHLSLGRLFTHTGQYLQAINHYGPIVKLQEPRFAAQVVEASLGLGQCFLAVGDSQSAARYLQQATTINPATEPLAQRLLSSGTLPGHR